MSQQRALETPASAPKQSQRDEHGMSQTQELGTCAVCLLPVAAHFDRPRCSGQNIGCAGARRNAGHLTDRHLAAAIGLGLSQFYKRKRRGEFARFELSPQLPDSVTRYSAALVQRWLDGERLDGPAS